MVRIIDIPAGFELPETDEQNEELSQRIANSANTTAPANASLVPNAAPIIHTGTIHASGSPVFDVRDYGWEHITTSVKEQNVIAALEAGHANWSVIPRSVIVDGEIVKGRIANCRSDLPPGSNVLEIVGSKYHIIQNRDALAFVQDVLALGNVRLVRVGSLNNGKTVFLQGSTEGITVNGDKIDPYVLFSNSHDGTSAVQVCLTGMRVFCKNTLALALKNAPRIWSVMHTKSADERMKAARESMDFIATYLEALPRAIEHMQETPVSDAQFEKIANILFPIPISNGKNTTAVTNAANRQAIFEAAYRNTPDNAQWIETAWGVNNAFTDVESHSEPLRVSQRFEENRFARNMNGRKLERAQAVIMQVATGA